MIGPVVSLVSALAPGLLDGPASVACVNTTRPKYLVFGHDATTPVCVVEFGAADDLRRSHEILTTLQPRLPGIVPRSVTLAPVRDDLWVHIQEGMPGLPWFRSGERLTSRESWVSLLTNAAATESTFRSAVAALPGWSVPTSLRVELDARRAELEQSALPLPPGLVAAVHAWSAPVPENQVSRPLQHGDFSLNNLLIGSERMALIDFEEFGETSVPLHDALGLSLSVPLSQAGSPLTLAEVLLLGTSRAASEAGVAVEHLPAHLMHHLLWRVRQCETRPRRAALRKVLLDWIDRLLAAPETFFPADLWSRHAENHYHLA